MANETGLDSTGVSTALPEWMREIALEARYANKKVWGHCFNAVEGDPGVVGKITKSGDSVTVQIFPAFTANDISTTDGAATDTETTLTTKTITIDQWKNVSATLVDIADFQAVIDWETNFAKGFGGAIGVAQDTAILTLVSSLTTNVDDTGGTFSDAKVRAAQAMLDDRNVPMSDRFWAICPQAHSDLLNIDKFTLANTTGFSKGVQVGDGRVVGLYGTPVEVSTAVITSTTRHNVLAHREAFGVVAQRAFKMEKFARTQYATRYGGSALYGVATLRDDHAVRVSSAL